MQIEDTNNFKNNFMFYWFAANAFGLAFGWITGEWLGLQVAGALGWGIGKVISFLFFEGSVWLFRWAVMSRLRAYDVLKPFDTFFWLTTELIIWLGIEFTPGDIPYREESLFGIFSVPILAYFIGVTGWLILWLVKAQIKTSRDLHSAERSFIASVKRVGGSLFVFIFFVLIMPLATSSGEAVAKLFNWMVGRAVAGVMLGGLLSLLTGSAILKLLNEPAWDE